jgi:hypothetical protein
MCHDTLHGQYIVCACVLSARICAFAYFVMYYLWMRVWLSVRSSLDEFSLNLLRTCYESPQVAWAMYFLYSSTARAWLSVRSSLDGFSQNLLSQFTCATYLHCSRAAHACLPRACIRLLIFGRILFKFGETSILLNSLVKMFYNITPVDEIAGGP